MPPFTIEQAMQQALQHHQAGRLAEAESIYRQVLSQQANHAGALHFLGVIAHQVGKHDIAVDLIARAIRLKPDNADAYINLAAALKSLGQPDEAAAACRQALALRPESAEAHNNLGAVLRDLGNLDDAAKSCRQAISLMPQYAEAHKNLGIILRDRRAFDESVAAFRRAIELHPDDAEVFSNLGVALKDQGKWDEAIVALRRAIELKADYAEAYSILGAVLRDLGQHDESASAHQRAVQLKPDIAAIHSDQLYAMLFHPACDAQALYAAHREWNARHAEPLKKFIIPHTNVRDPDRRLKIGYVSSDFRDHVVGRNLLPLLREHARERFDIVCYADVLRPDEFTRQFHSVADGWRNVCGLSDERVATIVREDAIDILVDLTLHMAGNRLMVFARKPAPVQVTFGGYPGTTGMDAMDYRLTDPYLDPVGQHDQLYSEQSIRLPDSFWCYDPMVMIAGAGHNPAVGPLPALSTGRITFGCLNNFCKVNDRVLGLWARVLKVVEGSRLILLVPEGSARQCTLDAFSDQGVEPARLEFVPRARLGDYLIQYGKFDIALDTFPYNGHTTSLDALWMGVPVVSLIGKTVAGRAGLSQLSNLNLAELVATDEDQYIQIAADLAADLPRLSDLRSSLRQRMGESPLTEPRRFARNIELAYRQIWRRWCIPCHTGSK
jgi:predicted O-linked N-acetylglucosamine transferase (SPINDLY family)